MHKPTVTALIVGSLVILFVGYLVVKGSASVAKTIKSKSVEELTSELGG